MASSKTQERLDDDEELSEWSVAEMRTFLDQRSIGHKDVVERPELEARVRNARHKRVRRMQVVKSGMDCPYLDTVNRSMLDFDFEKLCCQTMVNLNVYCCLVCGKYFQGRCAGSAAHTHALESDHYIFMNLGNAKIYCLPDDYEVKDASLEDIKYNLDPEYTRPQIDALSRLTRTSKALDGSEYLPGFIGMNNLKKTDGLNVVFQSLMRVKPLREFFLHKENYAGCTSLLVERFGELTRKMWNARNYKSQISPHEIVQACALASNKRFRPGHKSDPTDFLAFLLNQLSKDLAKSKVKPGQKKVKNIIKRCFQGTIHVSTEKIQEKKSAVSAAANTAGMEEMDIKYLSHRMELPESPLYKDDQNQLIIPTITMFELLEKFDGETSKEMRGGVLRRLRLKHPLPPFLIFTFKRFKRNEYFMEKNATLVTFPVKNLEMKDYADGQPKPGTGTKYNLVANCLHSGPTEAGAFSTHVHHEAADSWYAIEDLHVEEVLAQQTALTEAYIQIYQRNDDVLEEPGDEEPGMGQAPPEGEGGEGGEDTIDMADLDDL